MASEQFDCVCIFCNESLKDIDSLVDHMAEKHSQKSREKSSLNQSKEMSQTVHEFEPHRDELCEKIHGVSGFRCKNCSFHARSVVKVRRHSYFKHLFYRPFGCTYCGFLSMESSKVLQHCSLRHADLPSSDIQIKFGDPRGTKYGNLSKKVGFDDENRSAQVVSQKPQGSEGSELFNKSSGMHSSVTHQCGHCGVIFKERDAFLQHLLLCHSNISIYRCKFCQFSTNILQTMTDHHAMLHKPLIDVSRRKMPYSENDIDITSVVEFTNPASGFMIGSLPEKFQRKNGGHAALTDVQLRVMRFYGKRTEWLPDGNDFTSLPLETLDIHVGNKRIKCFYCSFRSHSCNLEHLFNHVLEFHSSIKPFSCSQCPYKSKSKDRVYIHSIINHDSLFNTVLEEKVEGSTLQSLFTVREYRNCVQLLIDDSVLVESPEVEESLISSHTGEFLETKKLRGDNVFNYLIHHQLQSVKKFCCGDCSFICDRSSIGDLLMHVATAHLGGVNLFTCGRCGYLDSDPTAVMTHQQTTHQIYGPIYGYYEDILCFLSLTHRWKDESMFFSVTEDLFDSECEDENKKTSLPSVGHYCQYCGLYFNSYNEAILHLVGVHSTLTPFSCDDCDFATGSVEVLQRHYSHFHPAVKGKSMRRIVEGSEISQLIEVKTCSSKKSKTFILFVSSVTLMLSDKATRPPKSKNTLKPVVTNKYESITKEYACLYCFSVNSSMEKMIEHVVWNHYPTHKLCGLNLIDTCENLQLGGDMDGIMLNEPNVSEERSCVLCGVKCDSQALFLGHFSLCINSRAKSSAWYQCAYCDYGESASNVAHSLVEHIQNNHSERLEVGLPIRSLLQIGDFYVFGVATWPLVDSKITETTVSVKTVETLQHYYCFYCGLEIVSNSPEKDVKAHFEETHKEKMAICCPACPDTFYARDDLERHFILHHGVLQICDSVLDYRRLNNEEHFEVRIKNTDIDTVPFFCGHCGFHRESEMKLMNQHIVDFHGNLMDSTCRFKLAVNNFGDKISSVLESSDPPIPDLECCISQFYCKYCETTEKSLDLIRDHMLTSHEDLWNLKCIYCMQTRATLGEIFDHNKEAHSDCLNEVNLNSRLVLELPENLNGHLTISAGIETTTATTAQKCVKLWCCGYCSEIAPTRSRDVVLRHISRFHRSKMRLRCRKCDFVSSDEFGLAVHHNKTHEGTADIDYFSLVDTTCFFSTNNDVLVAIQIRQDCRNLTFRNSRQEKSSNVDNLNFYSLCGVKPEGIELHKQALIRLETLSAERKEELKGCSPLSIDCPLFGQMWSKRAHEDGVRYSYCCNNCTYKTLLTADITRHILSVHLFIYPFRCPLCPTRGIRASNVSKHLVESHHGVEAKTLQWPMFSVPYYEFLFGDSVKCADMSKSETSKQESFSYPRVSSTPTNISKVELNCIKCNRYTVSMSDCQVVYRMKHHVFRHLSVKPFICVKCNADFSGRSNTIRHMHTVHKIDKNVAHSYIKQVLSSDDTAQAMVIVCMCAADMNYKVVKHRSGFKCVPDESSEPEYFPPGYEEEILNFRRNRGCPKVEVTRRCPICDEVKSSSYDVMQHLVKEHGQGDTVNCQQCDYSGKNWEEVVNHVAKHLGCDMNEATKDVQIMGELRKLLGCSPLSSESSVGTLTNFTSLMDCMGPLQVQRQGDNEFSFFSSEKSVQSKLPSPQVKPTCSPIPDKKVLFVCIRCTYTTHKLHNLKMHLGVHFDYSLRFQCSICFSRFRDAYSTNNHAADKHPGEVYEVLRIYRLETEMLVEDELIECVRAGGNYNVINASKMKFSCDSQKRKFELAIEEMRSDAARNDGKREVSNTSGVSSFAVPPALPESNNLSINASLSAEEAMKPIMTNVMPNEYFNRTEDQSPLNKNPKGPLILSVKRNNADRNYGAPLLVKINPQQLMGSNAKRQSFVEQTDNSIWTEKSCEYERQ